MTSLNPRKWLTLLVNCHSTILTMLFTQKVSFLQHMPVASFSMKCQSYKMGENGPKSYRQLVSRMLDKVVVRGKFPMEKSWQSSSFVTFSLWDQVLEFINVLIVCGPLRGERKETPTNTLGECKAICGGLKHRTYYCRISKCRQLQYVTKFSTISL